MKYLQQAVKLGDDTGELAMGEMYEKGLGTSQNLQAAIQHNFVASYRLANLYRDGIGVTENYKSAFDWYYESAKFHYAPAQEALGELYNLGLGTTSDQKKSYEWTSIAAKNGNKEAASRLVALKALLDSTGLEEANQELASAGKRVF